MKIIILVYKAIINVIYAFLKSTTKKRNKVVFLSRQSANINKDFLMIKKQLKGLETDQICVRDNGNISSKIRLAYLTVKSLAMLASCKVCVLDSYWPTVSLIKKKDFKVIQLWHSIGKIKKSGYQTIGTSSGRSKEMANLLNMHGNYDYVIAGSKYWNKYYCESFGIDEAVIRNYGLPRIDRLINEKEANREAFFNKYPKLKDKIIVLYAPTFRKGYDFDINKVVKQLATDKFNLIVKPHPNTKFDNSNGKYITCDEVNTEVVLSAADYLITDYSAIALEAAVINIKTYYFIPDYNEYYKYNGLNLKIEEVVGELCFRDANKLVKAIENGEYKTELFESYKKKFLASELGTSTEKVTNLIVELMNEGL